MSLLSKPRIICEVTESSTTPAGLADIAVSADDGILSISTSETTISFRLSEFHAAMIRAQAISRQQ